MTNTNRSFPWIAVAGLGAAVSVNLVMVGIAVSHPPTMASANAYEEAAGFQAAIEAREASRVSGLEVDLRATRDHVVLTVREASGQPVDGLAGQVTAVRPDEPALDQVAEFVGRGGGVYEASVRLARPGGWRLRTRLGVWVDDRRVEVGR